MARWSLSSGLARGPAMTQWAKTVSHFDALIYVRRLTLPRAPHGYAARLMTVR
jgi:hypothetical protein